MDNFSSSLTVCIDCTKSNQSNIVEQLLSTTSTSSSLSPNVVPSVEFSDQISVYPLRLETKYYTVDLGVCKINSPTIGSAEFADRVEAVLFHLDSTGDAMPAVDSWMSFVKHWEPNVQILLFDRLSPEKRQEVLLWCAKNEFELIEIDPDDDTRQEAEDCGEITGIRRVIQVLKAHSWPDLELKDESAENEERTKRLKDLLGDATEFGDFVHSDSVAPPSSFQQDDEESQELIEKLTRKLKVVEEKRAASANKELNGKEILDSDLTGGSAFASNKQDEGGVSFEDLFAKFGAFKTTADSLPDDQRRKFAEKVTLDFWRSIGGDEDDIKNLSGSDDDEFES